MATHGAMKAGRTARNAAGVVGIELLSAVQGLDFHRPLLTGPRLDKVVEAVRSRVPHYERTATSPSSSPGRRKKALAAVSCEEVLAEIF
jgi:histidine ammonia-lyase